MQCHCVETLLGPVVNKFVNVKDKNQMYGKSNAMAKICCYFHNEILLFRPVFPFFGSVVFSSLVFSEEICVIRKGVDYNILIANVPFS